jgi:hypothetical protein
MKRGFLLLLFTALLSGPLPAQADEFLLGFVGFDYEDPDPSPGTYLAIGDGYKAVGFVTSFGGDLTPYVDTVNNEYTFYLFGLTVATRDFDGVNLLVTFNDNGRMRYYEDSKTSGTNAQYGVNPPNATAPSTFIDGTLALGGDVDQFILFYDFDANQGGYSGHMEQDEGADLIWVDPIGGWTLAGLLGRPNPTIPNGYDNQISGECRIQEVVPTSHKTWGAIKATYR